MIEFVTLFISLVAGTHPVEVAVSGPVAAVEIVLDGRPVGVRHQPPWVVDCDFGADLTTHELVALTRDRDGRELARCRQLVNVPRPRAEASFLLERDERGLPRRARLLCAGAGNAPPRVVHLAFDGMPLPATSLERIVLPDYDPSETHLLSARLEFPDNVTARADAVFAGAYGGLVRTELTAVPVVIGEGDDELHTVNGVFRAGGRQVAVAGVETAGSLVLVVRDRLTKPKLYRLGVEQERLDRRRFRPDEALVPGELGADRDRLRFVVPIGGRHAGGELPADLFPVSRAYELGPGLLPWLLTHLMSPDMLGQRLADAVAVAGVRAAGGRCPRAVILIVDGTPEDGSRQRPGAVRSFLAQLRVPLYVWSTDPDRLAVAGWGPARDVSTRGRLKLAAKQLGRDLARQRMVWIEGHHLPNAVTLTPGTTGITLLE